MFASEQKIPFEQVEKLIQFASKTEITKELQAYWYNKYVDLFKSNMYSISPNTLVLTLQADESARPATPCGSVILSNHLHKSREGNYTEVDENTLQVTIEVVVRLLDSLLESINFNGDARKIVSEYRKIGVSVEDFNFYLKTRNNTLSELDEIDYIGSLISNGAYRASESIAEEKGVCQSWEAINKNIKPKTFEYWYNIDSGEIKSGLEIVDEFDEGSIKTSKFEIVPRRNSHILLYPADSQWYVWSDREKITSKPVEMEKPEIQPELKPELKPEIKPIIQFETETKKEMTPETKSEMDPGKNMEKILINANLQASPSNISKEKSMPEMLSIEELLNSVQRENSGKENEDIKNTRNYFDPSDILNQIPSPVENFSNAELMVENVKQIEKKEIGKNGKNFGGFDFGKLFSFGKSEKIEKTEMPEGGASPEKHETPPESIENEIKNLHLPVYETEELKNLDDLEIFVEKTELNLEKPINSEVEMAKFDDVETEKLGLKEVEIESLNLSTKSTGAIQEETKMINLFEPEIFTENIPETKTEMECGYSVGELVKITQINDKNFGKYMQVVDIKFDIDKNCYYLGLLDGISGEKEMIFIDCEMVEPASIEQVLINLNKPKEQIPQVNQSDTDQIIEIEKNIEDKIINVQEKTAQSLSFEKAANDEQTDLIEETNSSVILPSYTTEHFNSTVKILLLNNLNQAILIKQKNGQLSLPEVSFNDLNHEIKIELAITELLSIKYNMSGVRDLCDAGFYTDIINNPGQIYIGVYGYIDGPVILGTGLLALDVMEAYKQSYDLSMLLDKMSESEKQTLEAISAREIEITKLREQIAKLTENVETNHSNQNNHSDDDITTQIAGIQSSENNEIDADLVEINNENITEIMPENPDYSIANGNISVVSKEQNFAKSYGSIINNSNNIPQQNYNDNLNQSYMTHVQAQTPISKQTSPLNSSFYQSTSAVASYSKFAITLRQIIHTADFGDIMISVHYDLIGPKVLIVELPQLINDSLNGSIKTYLNLINAALIRGTDLSIVVNLIQDQLELTGETGPITSLVGVVLNAVNALPKSLTEITSNRVLSYDAESLKDLIRTGADPIKALSVKFLGNSLR